MGERAGKWGVSGYLRGWVSGGVRGCGDRVGS